MEKKYFAVVALFVSITVISLLGFFNSYISFFPKFDAFDYVIHIHFIAFVCWFVLIILQPILIRRRKYDLHQRIGKLSYFLAPILVITILILVYREVVRDIKISENMVYISSFIGILDALTFAIYYSIAMFNIKNIRWHVAFIIAATLVVFNPGLSRLANLIQPGLGIPLAVFFPILITLSILLYEKLKLKRPLLKSPYFVFLCCWIFEIILFVSIPNTKIWRDLLYSNFA
jgi:hypothetical protein